MVSLENAEEYVELMFDFCMHAGIQKQMEAFRGERTPSRDGRGWGCSGQPLTGCVSRRGFQPRLPHGEAQLVQPEGGADDPLRKPIPLLDRR